MNSTQIRIKQETKKELDRLMSIRVKEIFNQADKAGVNKILRDGYSYAAFVDELVLCWKECKPGKQRLR